MRVLGFVFLAWLALVGYQAQGLHTHSLDILEVTSNSDYQVDAHAGDTEDGHSEHSGSCGAHASCSPALAAAANDVMSIDLVRVESRGVAAKFASQSFSPSSPPPKI